MATRIESLRQALNLTAQLDNAIEDAKYHIEDLPEISQLIERLESLISDELGERERQALQDTQKI